MKKMNRREFFEASAGAATAAALLPSMKAVAQGPSANPHTESWPENGTLIPDEGWRLWVDREAEWKQDEIFLPEDVMQDAEGVVHGKDKALPVHPPTGGWAVLTGQPAGSVAVTLPGTV
jgi:hypothetical protein